MGLVYDALTGNHTTQKPLWLMRQAGRYLPEYQAVRACFPHFMDFCFTPDAVCEVTLQPIERFGFDAAIIFSDILVIPHLLGQRVDFQKDHGPVLQPLSATELLVLLETRTLGEELEPIRQAITQTRSTLTPPKDLIGFAGAPWTLATYMLSHGKTQDFTPLIAWGAAHAEIFERLLTALCSHITTLLCAHIEAGCNVVQIFDSWAGAVPSTHVESWVLRPLVRIVTAVRQVHPNIPIIYFARGAAHTYPDLAHLNIAFSVDEQTAMDGLMLDSTIPLQGNLSPQALAEGAFEAQACHLLTHFANRPYIFNLGHGILPHTPLTHVETLVRLVREQS